MDYRGAGHKNPWAAIVGPCYTPASFARTLGWTDAAVTEAADSLAVLKLTTIDGAILYPAFQVWKAEPVEGLAEVLQVLRTSIDDPWTWAQWLNTPLLDEDGIERPTNIQRLRDSQLAVVLRDAEHDGQLHGKAE